MTVGYEERATQSLLSARVRRELIKKCACVDSGLPAHDRSSNGIISAGDCDWCSNAYVLLMCDIGLGRHS